LPNPPWSRIPKARLDINGLRGDCGFATQYGVIDVVVVGFPYGVLCRLSCKEHPVTAFVNTKIRDIAT
jgi:hypothetical protein